MRDRKVNVAFLYSLFFLSTKVKSMHLKTQLKTRFARRRITKQDWYGSF